MGKITASLIGDPVLMEEDLKQDFANRYFDTNSVLIILDGEWYDGSYAKRYGEQLHDGVSYLFTKLPEQFPEGKRVVVIHTQYPLSDKETNAYIKEAGEKQIWNDAIQKMIRWDFPETKNVTIYAVNDAAIDMDVDLLRSFLDTRKAAEGRLFLMLDAVALETNKNDLKNLIEQLDTNSDVVAVYNEVLLHHQETLVGLLKQRFHTWDDRKFSFLKYTPTIPFFSKLAFHSFVDECGVLLVPRPLKDYYLQRFEL